MSKYTLNTIEEAIEDIKNGKVIIVVDDEDRENEGDFLAAAEHVTPEMINFMATHGKGLICAPISEKRSKELQLLPMVTNNTVLHETAFTVSVDLIGQGCTTGISAHDRAKTILAMVNPKTQPNELGKPGHIFPLIAKKGGVLRRTGHTEAAVDFARLAGLAPAGVICEIMNEDGTMARLPELYKVAQKFDLKIVSIEDLIAYRMQHDSLVEKKEDFEIETKYGKFRLRAYKQVTNQQVHIALTKGNWQKEDAVLTRINSTQINRDILQQLSNEHVENLDDVFKKVETEKNAAILFINQELNTFNLLGRLEKIKNSENGLDDLPKPQIDSKDFGIGAQILHDLNIRKMKLLTNSEPSKRVGIEGYGLEIVDYVSY